MWSGGPLDKVDSTRRGGLGSIASTGMINGSWPPLPDRIDGQMGL